MQDRTAIARFFKPPPRGTAEGDGCWLAGLVGSVGWSAVRVLRRAGDEITNLHMRKIKAQDSRQRAECVSSQQPVGRIPAHSRLSPHPVDPTIDNQQPTTQQPTTNNQQPTTDPPSPRYTADIFVRMSGHGLPTGRGATELPACSWVEHGRPELKCELREHLGRAKSLAVCESALRHGNVWWAGTRWPTTEFRGEVAAVSRTGLPGYRSMVGRSECGWTVMMRSDW